MLEELRGGGLLLVRDSAEAEGRSLLRSLTCEAAASSGPVLVVLLEVSREEFEVGLSPEVSERLEFWDIFGDPLGWLGRDPQTLGAVLGELPSLPSPPQTLVLDSLSWGVLREPLPHLCRALGALLAPKKGPPARILALLHQDLHPSPTLAALGGLCRAQLLLGPSPTPGAPRSLSLARDPRAGGGALQEPLPPPPGPSPAPQNPQKVPNLEATPLTFRLGLSGAERGARAALSLPYLPRTDRTSPEPPPEDPEDPDEDLDL